MSGGVITSIDQVSADLCPSAEVWLPMLQRALTALDDLECSALWQTAGGEAR